MSALQSGHLTHPTKWSFCNRETHTKGTLIDDSHQIRHANMLFLRTAPRVTIWSIRDPWRENLALLKLRPRDLIPTHIYSNNSTHIRYSQPHKTTIERKLIGLTPFAHAEFEILSKSNRCLSSFVSNPLSSVRKFKLIVTGNGGAFSVILLNISNFDIFSVFPNGASPEYTHKRPALIALLIVCTMTDNRFTHWPDTNSNNTHPNAHQSTGKLCNFCIVLLTSSGAIYITVPHPSWRGCAPSSADLIIVANPKSHSRTCPCRSMRMFSGFRSL